MKKPADPILPQTNGAVGSFLRGVKTFIRTLLDNPRLWGNDVTVTFTGADTDTRVDHGLGYRPSGFWVVSSAAAVSVYLSPSTPSDNKSLYLRASAATVLTVYVY